MGTSTKSTPVTQTTTYKPPEEAKQLLSWAMPNLETFAKTPPQLPDFSTVAPFDPLQTAGQEQVLSAAQGQDTIVGSAGDASTRMTSGELLYPDSNPALRATISAATRPIIDELLEKALPAIRSGAYTTDNFGSSRQGIAEGLAIGRAGRAVGDVGAGIATEGYKAGLDTMEKGVALAPSTAQAQLLPGLTTSGVGDVRQGMSQALLNEQAAKFNYEQLLPLLVGKELAGIAAGIPGGQSTATGQMISQQPSPFMQGAGLGVSALGALSGGPGLAANAAALAPLMAALW